MISIVLTMVLLLIIIEGNMFYNKDPDIIDTICIDLITEARKRYLDAYKNVAGHNKATTFDQVLKSTKFINGTFNLSDHYTFKHVVCDAVGIDKYTGNVKRSEAMFVMDFIMEAYHEISPKYQRVDINLSRLKDHV
jgi:hypothetical protein